MTIYVSSSKFMDTWRRKLHKVDEEQNSKEFEGERKETDSGRLTEKNKNKVGITRNVGIHNWLQIFIYLYQ